MSVDAVPGEMNRGCWELSLAGTMAGAAIGIFVVTLLSRLDQSNGLYAFEPLAALPAGLGAWAFSPGRSVRDGVLGAAAAAAAMLAGGLFHFLITLGVPVHFGNLSQALLLYGREIPDVPWPKCLRFLFGVYLGWYLGYSGRARADREARPEDAREA